jgi:upstream activation factor subunit UAF30
MARTKTSKTASETTEQVSATTTTPAVVEPVVEKAPKVKKEKTVKAAKVEAAPVDNSTVAEESVAAPEDVVDGEAPIAEQSVEFQAKLQQISVVISSLKAEYRALEKKWARELKLAQKQSSKRSKRKAGNRAPSGFVKPTRISDELAKFLDKPTGTEMARTEVTREINVYIRENKLQDKENGRKINADPKLAGLLKLKKTDELTYFNLQKYMSPHFAKTVKETTVVA